MGKAVYIGIGDKARKVKKIYLGVGGVAHKVKKGYIGINGVAKQFFSAESARYRCITWNNGNTLDSTTSWVDTDSNLATIAAGKDAHGMETYCGEFIYGSFYANKVATGYRMDPVTKGVLGQATISRRSFQGTPEGTLILRPSTRSSEKIDPITFASLGVLNGGFLWGDYGYPGYSPDSIEDKGTNNDGTNYWDKVNMTTYSRVWSKESTSSYTSYFGSSLSCAGGIEGVVYKPSGYGGVRTFNRDSQAYITYLSNTSISGYNVGTTCEK